MSLLQPVKNIQLHFLKEVERLEMGFDPDQLTKVVSNLLSNAIKFTPEGGNVYLTVRNSETPASEFFELCVRDTGAGIPSEELPRIFDRFYQADVSSTRKAAGAGIGLRLAKELVELMGGKIKVQSTLGEGTNFCVLLPISRSAPGKDIKEPPVIDFQEDAYGATENIEHPGEINSLPTKEAKTTLSVSKTAVSEATASGEKDLPVLLLIEDDRDVLTYLASCLDTDYQLEFSTDGKEGIQHALEIVPDLIISDVMMPEKDGYEVCTTLKEDIRTSHIPIILLTAKASRNAKWAWHRVCSGKKNRDPTTYLKEP